MKTSVITPKNGYFGIYGGQFVPPALEAILGEVEREYVKARRDPAFMKEYRRLLHDYVGRPSPIYFASRLTKYVGGAQIYLKREDLNHTGAHKINHTIGEGLLAKRMGKTKLLAETGAGQHGVALATAAAMLGLECEIHMGAIDMDKQAINVERMHLLGANVVRVEAGGKSLKEAVDSAFAAYITDPEHTFFGIGSVVGPRPYPEMVRDFQSIVGREAKRQFKKMTGKLPDHIVACVGGGSNAIGLFSAFLRDTSVRITGVEPSGRGLSAGDHAATLSLGTPGTLHGMFTYLLQDKQGEPLPVHSIASGLDYPGVGPEHSALKDSGRVHYKTCGDTAALEAFKLLSRIEGIIPALESAHAVAYAIQLAKKLPKDATILVNLSGRGDKDVEYVATLQ